MSSMPAAPPTQAHGWRASGAEDVRRYDGAGGGVTGCLLLGRGAHRSRARRAAADPEAALHRAGTGWPPRLQPDRVATSRT